MPVALTYPPVRIFPPITLPGADMPPPDPLDINVLPYTLPVTLNPVGVNTATLPTPLTPTVTLPLDVDMVTLLVPLAIFAPPPPPLVIPVKKAPLPKI